MSSACLKYFVIECVLLQSSVYMEEGVSPVCTGVGDDSGGECVFNPYCLSSVA